MARKKTAAERLEDLEPTGLYGAQVIASLLGKSPRRIQQLVSEGIVPKPVRGRYALGPVVAAYVAHVEGQARAAGARGGRQLGVSDATAARARLDNAKAEKAELEAAEARGDLLPRDQVRKVWGQVVGAARNRVLAVPSRMIQRCRIGRREREVLREELHRALYDLAAGDGINLAQESGEKSK